MAQHGLDGAQVRPVLQQVGGEGVAQGVGCDVLLDPRLLLVELDELPEALAAHALSVHVHKQGGLLRGLHQLGAHLMQVLVQGPHGGGVQGDDPLLPLADAPEHSGGQVQVVHVQGNELADPDAGGVQQLQHGPVPAALQIGAVGLLQKQLHLFAGEDLGQLALHLGGHHPLGRVVVHDPQGDEAAVEGLDGGDGTGHRGRRLPLPGERGGVALHVLGQHLLQLRVLAGHGRLKLAHVPQVGADRIGRRPLFSFQILLIQVQ